MWRKKARIPRLSVLPDRLHKIILILNLPFLQFSLFEERKVADISFTNWVFFFSLFERCPLSFESVMLFSVFYGGHRATQAVAFFSAGMTAREKETKTVFITITDIFTEFRISSFSDLHCLAQFWHCKTYSLIWLANSIKNKNQLYLQGLNGWRCVIEGVTVMR